MDWGYKYYWRVKNGWITFYWMFIGTVSWNWCLWKNQDGKYGLTSDGHLVFVTILLERMFDDKLTNDELVNKLIENGVIELKDNNMFCVTKKGIEIVLLFLMWNFDNKNALKYIKKYKRYVNRFNNL